MTLLAAVSQNQTNMAAVPSYNPYALTPPPRFKAAKWSDVPKDVQKHIEAIREHRKGLYLHGDCGTGKTHLVWGISQKFAEMAVRHTIINSTNLLADIREDFDKRKAYSEWETTLDKLSAFKGVIIIDDLGAEKHSEWVAETFYHTINKKYEAKHPMIFTSNYTLDEIADRIGDRVASRIFEMTKVVHLKGEDRRLKN